MQYLKNIIIAIPILLNLISFSYSDTSWIKKKSDKVNGFCVQKSSESTFGYPVTILKKSSICEGKDIVVTKENSAELFRFLKKRNNENKGAFFITKKEFSENSLNKEIKKVVKAEKETTSWIKKKEVKENKKKVKEKIKDSKSWITKKSKEKVKDIKEKLKKHKSFEKLPKGEFYFAGYIEPLENEEIKYVYGYVNSDDKSETFKVGNKNFYSKSDGVAYFEDKTNRCEIDSFIGVLFGDIKGKVVLKCKKGLDITGDFKQVGKGNGETSDGNNVEFEFYSTKKEAIAKLNDFKNDNSIETKLVERQLPKKDNKKILLKPNGKYYALLIGNSNYDNQGWDDLVSPINDITAIKSVLDKSYKFEKIIMVKDGTKKQILKAFRNLSKLTTTNDYVLIYYSGHGLTKATQAYWIPKDGSLEWGLGDWINVSELNIYLTEIKAHHLAVMVDSCYVGGKFKGTNILDLKNDEHRAFMTDHLEDDLNLRARIVLSSGSEGRVSDTAPNSKNSIFALSFLNILKTSEKLALPLSMTDIGFNVKRAFIGNYNQKPYYYHPDTWEHQGGDFLFIPKRNIQ